MYRVLKKGNTYVTRNFADALDLQEQGYEFVTEEQCLALASTDPKDPNRALHVMAPLGVDDGVIRPEYFRNATEEEIAKYRAEGNPKLDDNAVIVGASDPLPADEEKQEAIAAEEKPKRIRNRPVIETVDTPEV